MERLSEKWQDFIDKSPPEKILFILPYFLSCFLCCRIIEMWRLSEGNALVIIQNYQYIYKTFPNFAITDLVIGVPVGWMLVAYRKWNVKIHSKNTKKGVEYGSARWGNAKDIKPYIDENFYNNLILSATEFLTLKPRMNIFKLNRNKHVLVEGGSGTGKTYGPVKGNLLQAVMSYVVVTTKGDLLPETGNLFYKKGYRIKSLDTVDFDDGMHYNPFVYIKRPKDILTLANALLKNLKPKDAGPPVDPMWDQASLLWMQSVIGYLWYEAPPEEQNIPTMLEFLEADEVREDDETFQNAVDMLFAELEKKNPRHFAVKQRKKYKKAAGKTAKSILITLGSMFSPFDIPEVNELFSYDELELDTFGDANQKSILYVNMSDTDESFNFILGILFSQMFQVLTYKADKIFSGKLKTPIMFILDEFAQYFIPNFEIILPAIRSRLMSCMLFLQTRSQLKERYKDSADTIVGNCDSHIFLGGNDKTTLKDLEEMLGDETIDLWNDGRSYGNQSDTSSVNFNKTGRKLKKLEELQQMDRDKCIVQIAGLPPFFSDKYDIHNHPNFKYLADYSDKNIFDFKKYQAKQRRKKEKENIIKFHNGDSYKAVSVEIAFVN